MTRRVGPDAARYLLAARGVPVPRPFNLRWFLPWVCGDNVRGWWPAYVGSFVTLGVASASWRLLAGDPWQVAVAVAVFVCGLPGILGPVVSVPVQVDLPSTALVAVSLCFFEVGGPVGMGVGVGVVAIATAIRETSPFVAALWAWSWLPLLAVPIIYTSWLQNRPGSDPLGEPFQTIADHPVRSAIEHHAGHWRDGWVMVAPWGVCLAGLYEPDWRLLLIVVVAYGQLFVATDTVRLYQHVAGLPLAVAAAHVIPVAWLPLAAVVHVAWFRPPARV